MFFASRKPTAAPARNAFRPALESFERRDTPAMLAGSTIQVINNYNGEAGHLMIIGTNSADKIELRTGTNLDTVMVHKNGSSQGDFATGVNRITVHGNGGNDTITNYTGKTLTAHGDGGNDTITGGDARNVLYGGDGSDTLVGGDFADTLDGGAGNDALVGGGGADYLYGGSGDDLLRGGDGNDRLYGDAGNDILWGEMGRDFLYGGDDNDTLWGGKDGQDDILTGDSGSDTFIIDQPDWFAPWVVEQTRVG